MLLQFFNLTFLPIPLLASPGIAALTLLGENESYLSSHTLLQTTEGASSYFGASALGSDAASLFSSSSFCTLFLSMMFYWIQTAFSSIKKIDLPSAPILITKKVSNLLSFPYKVRNFGTITMVLSNLLLMCLLILRWKESGHFPLSNLYESLMFLSWSCTFIHLILERVFWVKVTPSMASPSKGGHRAPSIAGGGDRTSSPSNRKKVGFDANLFTKLIGSITAPSALFTNAFATFSLPIEMQKASPLVPALQSNWLMMHVTVMIISYSALILGSLLSIAFLILVSVKPSSTSDALFISEPYPSVAKPAQEGLSFTAARDGAGSVFLRPSIAEVAKRDRGPEGAKILDRGAGSNFGSETKRVTPLSVGRYSVEEGIGSKGTGAPSHASLRAGGDGTPSDLAWNFDNLSYRVLGIGFPFLTIGILSGAVWANEAWGSYWSWDPKETWALLTWLIFAIYLHARITKGWQGKKPAIIASFGFLAIWVCFLGVNLIGEGLHSYGWFSLS